MKKISITLLIISTILSCSSPAEKGKRLPGTYHVYGFQEKVEISTSPIFDSIMAELEPWLDSINEQIGPTFDSINEAFEWSESHSMKYNFEIDHTDKIILFHEKGEPYVTYDYQRIVPLGNSRKYVITDIESFIFYGNVDSVLYSVDETLMTLFR